MSDKRKIVDAAIVDIGITTKNPDEPSPVEGFTWGDIGQILEEFLPENAVIIVVEDDCDKNDGSN